MRYLEIGGLKLSSVAFGTHTFGKQLSCEDSGRMLDAYFAGGGNVIDTARCYAEGESEKCIGKWFRNRPEMRDKAILITKCSNPEYEKIGDNQFGNFVRHRVNQKDIDLDLETSLEALGTDYIDIWFIHKYDPAVEAGAAIEMVNKHIKSGKVRKIGASNWPIEKILEANEYAEAHGLAKFEFSELAFSPYFAERKAETWGAREFMRKIDYHELPMYQKNKFPTIAYNAQAHSFFYKNFGKPDSEIDSTPENIACLRRFEKLCRDKNMEPEQVVFGFFAGIGFPVIALASTKSAEHLDRILYASDAVLTAEEANYFYFGDKKQ